MKWTDKELGRAVTDYRNAVVAVAYCATGDAASADDLAQEAFVLAWRKRPQVRDMDHLRAWLMATVRNLARNYNRKARRSTPAALEVADNATPLDYFAASQLADAAECSLAAMPEGQREALVIFYRSESHAEVAAHLELSESAARQRVNRARQSLRADVDRFLRADCRRGRDRKGFAAAVVAALGLASAATGAQAAGKTTGASTGGTSLAIKLALALSATLIIAFAAVTMWISADSPLHLVVELSAPVSAPAPKSASSQRLAPPTDVIVESADDQAAKLEGLVDQPLIVKVVRQSHPEADVDGDGDLSEDELRLFAASSDERLASTLLALSEQELPRLSVKCRAATLLDSGVSEEFESYSVDEFKSNPGADYDLSPRQAALSWIARQKTHDDRICTELSVYRSPGPENALGVVDFDTRAAKVLDGTIEFARLYSVHLTQPPPEDGFPATLPSPEG